MPWGAAIKLGVWVGAFLVFGSGVFAQSAEFISSFTWSTGDPDLGGLSALEVTDRGTSFIALSDRAQVIHGQLSRDPQGRISDIQHHLKKLPRGRDFDRRWGYWDSEGLAVTPDGEVYISFEGSHLVVRYRDFVAFGHELPRPDMFDGLEGNGSLEAVAVDAAGNVFTLPERSGNLNRPFPVFRFDGTSWTQPFRIQRKTGFLAVGADFGPDGRFYLLERRFDGPWGFSTRVRSFEIAGDDIGDERHHLTTTSGTHDNLEGLSVWKDATGALRLTMISDNNFRSLQRTEIVEYRINP